MTRARAAIVGVVESANTAVLVTLAGEDLLDRRTVVLTEPGTPTHPHHHEGSWAVGRYLGTPGAKPIPLADAISLVERVRSAAEQGARDVLEALASSLPVPISRIALRACPELPATIEERIRDPRAQTVADSVMYRESLARAAEARGWEVRWYDRARVLDDARAQDVVTAIGRSIGPPWRAEHKLAAAAAVAASRASRAS